MHLWSDPRRELFDELFASLHTLVFSWLFGQTGSREMAEDTLQDTFVRVWSHIDAAGSIPEPKRKTWVLVLARSALGDHRRRAAVRKNLNAACPDEEAVDHAASPAVQAIRNDEIERLQREIEDLSVPLRTVLTMTVVGGMTSEEIGEALGKPAGTVRSQLFDARKRLAKRMGI
jgi:RNA polymerase sigma factor (sigma-70 family)